MAQSELAEGMQQCLQFAEFALAYGRLCTVVLYKIGVISATAGMSMTLDRSADCRLPLPPWHGNKTRVRAERGTELSIHISNTCQESMVTCAQQIALLLFLVRWCRKHHSWLECSIRGAAECS